MRLLIMLLFLSIGTSAIANNPIPFTLKNTTLKSIPLKIPGVMNPNLSPMSKSGVNLEIGQKIYFINKRKKVLLLEVSEELKGKELDVSKLIKERKRELKTS